MIRVAIVDDQKVVTQGLKMLLGSEPDIEIVGTGGNGREAIDLVANLGPDVLLIDQHMPIMDGVEATQVICNRFPGVAVLLLSGSDQDNYITDALQAGAKGYLLKNTSAEDLANSIRSVHRGYSQMGPGLLEKILAKVNSEPSPQPTLSSQEMELRQILSYPTNFDVARMNHIMATVDDPQLAATLMVQLEKRLQSNPNHVGALYLSGRLISEFQQHSRLAMNYLRLAFSHAQTQAFSLSVLLHIVQAAWANDAAEAFRWLSQVVKNWPVDQSSRKLFDEFVQVFGGAGEPYRLLKSAWEIEQLHRLCVQTNALKSKLATLGIKVTEGIA